MITKESLYPDVTKLIDVTYGKSEQNVDRAEVQRMSELWSNVIPKSGFDMVAAVTADPEYMSAFKSALAAGTADTFIKDKPTVPYTVLSDEASLTSERDKKVRSQADPQFLMEINEKINVFLAELHSSKIPEVVKKAYEVRANGWKQYCKATIEIGKPEFTQLQTSNDRWIKLIAPESFEHPSELKLKHEDAAFDVLRLAKQRGVQSEDEVKAEEEKNGILALDFLHLSKEDFKDPTTFAEIESSTELNATQLQQIFEICFSRAGMLKDDKNQDGWEVVVTERGVTMDVNAASKEVSIPKSHTEPRVIGLWGLPHEFVHILRGESGSKQDAQLLQTGTLDYESTDEGIAMLAELLAGEPFGHQRQVEVAARYLAIALSLKTKVNNDGQRVAKHSIQEIYDILKNEGVHEGDLKAILWRINRGTSFRRSVTDVKINVDGIIYQYPVAETFVKDAIYFEGQMEVFNLVQQLLPFSEQDKENRIVKSSRDLNPRMLARIGNVVRKSLIGEQAVASPAGMLSHEGYEMLAELGKAAIEMIIDYLSVGKMKTDELIDPEWNKILKRDDLVRFRDFFMPNAV